MGATRDAGAGARRPRQWVVPGALLILGVAIGMAGLIASGGDSGVGAPRQDSSMARQPGNVRQHTRTDLVRRSAPVGLSIPAIGVVTSVSRLGLNADGTVEVPTDFAKAGWCRLGPSPGQMGSSVILGHVDDRHGPAVFFNLHSLTSGDDVVVVLADGRTEHFAVTSVASYVKADFPRRRIYGAVEHRTLNLVTCGGMFNESTGSYLSNVVVSTRLTSTEPAIPNLFTSHPSRE